MLQKVTRTQHNMEPNFLFLKTLGSSGCVIMLNTFNNLKVDISLAGVRVIWTEGRIEWCQESDDKGLVLKTHFKTVRKSQKTSNIKVGHKMGNHKKSILKNLFGFAEDLESWRCHWKVKTTLRTYFIIRI